MQTKNTLDTINALRSWRDVLDAAAMRLDRWMQVCTDIGDPESAIVYIEHKLRRDRVLRRLFVVEAKLERVHKKAVTAGPAPQGCTLDLQAEMAVAK